MEKLESDMIQS